MINLTKLKGTTMDLFLHDKYFQGLTTEGQFDLMTAYACAEAYHLNQFRKHTNEAYIEHPTRVALTVLHTYEDLEVVQAALMHDTIEDTQCTYEDIKELLGKRVADLTLELSNPSKPKDGDRATRKAIDHEHLKKISHEGATVKLADILDNVPSIIRYDPRFAKKYVPEKLKSLEVLKHGNKNLWEKAHNLCTNYVASPRFLE
jgi:(p)ppGpp synthase/HD superfamily hydrolase